MSLKRLAGYGPAVVLAISIFLLWELVVRVNLVNIHLLPTPTSIVQALIANWDVISIHTLQTSLETVLGLAIATVLGLVLAVLLDLSPWIRRSVYPLLITSQTIPMVALAPLLVIWFGLDLTPKIIVVTLYCFFPIAVACADGLASTDPDLMKLLQSMRASRWQILWLVRLPGALPAFFSGLRIAATYSVTGAIVGEYVAAEQGLGLYMKTAASSNAIVLVFAAIVVTALLSLLLFGLVSLLEYIALPWHQRFGQTR
ncbi:nitrate ABC transporter permease [Dictyobacter alpinus]|uniref:Nitrate ABC transporter permease n=1 Tax=Dictyobacter alpinus TaxID=2014873 RepID=A0A402BGD3_9CHLR|nr:ABC transporter permease [Dictyobacter alpinus]GCE30474.1 nitrate ABC transporter permease [Dictyobacter alpinus]